jgi:hypothetical protein
VRSTEFVDARRTRPMRAAPAFELTLALSATERALLALLSAAVAAALAAWAWSHVDAAAGPAGRGLWPWFVVVPLAAAVGFGIGWSAARPESRTLRWHQGLWTWTADGIEHEGTVQPKLDLGSWLLLMLRPRQGARRWATVGRQRAGPAWHPLRAVLFAPGRIATEPGTGESTPT